MTNVFLLIGLSLIFPSANAANCRCIWTPEKYAAPLVYLCIRATSLAHRLTDTHAHLVIGLHGGVFQGPHSLGD